MAILIKEEILARKGENTMTKFTGAVLMALAWMGLAFAQTPTPQAKGPSVEQTVTQLEHDWVNAEKAHDVNKLSQILADDWVGLNYDGKKDTKQSALAEVKSGAEKIDSLEFGPMDVMVLGNVAVVQGSDTEKSSTKGKDTSGKWVWMDVFVQRGGKWVAVRSQSAMVK